MILLDDQILFFASLKKISNEYHIEYKNQFLQFTSSNYFSFKVLIKKVFLRQLQIQIYDLFLDNYKDSSMTKMGQQLNKQSQPQKNTSYTPPNRLKPEINQNQTRGLQHKKSPLKEERQGVISNQRQRIQQPKSIKFQQESSSSEQPKEREKKNKRQSQMMYEDEVLPPGQIKGLPNIGNNCFLNSVIQFLFSAPKFRKLLENKFKNNESIYQQKHSPSYLLGALFYYIEHKGNFDQLIRQTLKDFLACLEHLNISYEMYKQEDAFETMNNLLCNLDYTQEEENQIKQMFELITQIKCKCLPRYIRTATMFPKCTPQICQGCHQNFQQKTVKYPRYMIIPRYNNQYKKFEKGRENYLVNCDLRYYGTGYSGHYNVRTYKGEKRYNINDSSVQRGPDYPRYVNCCFVCFCCQAGFQDGLDRDAHFSLVEKVVPKQGSANPSQGCCEYNFEYGGFVYNCSQMLFANRQQNQQEVISEVQCCCFLKILFKDFCSNSNSQ